MSVSIERLESLLRYDPDMGTFFWRKSRGSVKAGSAAGTNSHGYVIIIVDRKHFRAHRLAWFFTYKKLPEPGFEIDHINGLRSDNRIANLRLATRTQNNANSITRPDNRVGLKGVSPIRKKFQARQGDRHLGVFDTAEEAHAAYKKAAQEVFGNFARFS